MRSQWLVALEMARKMNQLICQLSSEALLHVLSHERDKSDEYWQVLASTGEFNININS